MRSFGSIACSGLALAALAGCQSTPDRDALRKRWHSNEPAGALTKAAPWIELTSPDDGKRLEGVVALVEVSGHAGAGGHGPQDIVLAIDTSGSVFTASGIDFDGDGVVGTDVCGTAMVPYCGSQPREWTTDFDDIVLKVEIDAAQKLVAQLDPATTRMGFVKFGETAWVEEGVGPLAALSASLANFRYVMRGGTDIVGALHTSIDLLEAAPPRGAGPAQRAILLLTDGQMAVGDMDPYQREDYLSGLLARARATRTRIFSFGIGPLAEKNSDLLDAFAGETGGASALVPASRDITVELQLVGLTGLADVELRNATTDAPGRAVRVFPDGSFDGYAPLVPGNNELEVRATLADGRTVVTQARVFFAKAEHPTTAQLEAAARLAEELRERTVSTDLAVRVQAERRRRARQLRITPE